MHQIVRRRFLPRAACLLLLINAGISANARADGPVLDCLTPNGDGVGYDQFAWTTMTADLDAANGAPLATAKDLSNLQQLMSYTGLWVDVRQPNVGTLTTTETANLQTYIASGRRVVLIGGPGPQPLNSNFSSWNDAILSAVGGPTGTTYFASSTAHPVTPYRPTSPVSFGLSISVPAGATASSGVTLFADRVATLWGPAQNAIVLLDTATLNDDNLKPNTDNSTFAMNLASWVAGGESDGPSSWITNAGGTWQTAANWSPDVLPSVADDAVFNLGSAGYVVTVPSPLTARNMIVQNDHVTLDLSTASSNLTLSQGISVGQTASSSASLTFTHSTGTSPAAVAAMSLSLGGGGVGTLTIGNGVNLSISGATTVAAASTLIVNGGTLTTGTITAAGPVSVSAGSLQITTAASAGTLNTIHLLTLNGTLDLANTDLDLQTGSLATITSEIKTGYAGGTWAGNGIISSAAASDPTHLTTLGVIINNDGANHAIYGTGTTLGLFDNTSPAVNDLLVKYTYFGDANLDGQVDGSDYTKIDNGYHNSLTGWANGDFNYDGIIDGSDYTLIDNAFNTQAIAPIISDSNLIAGSASVPEPAMPGLLAIGAIGLSTRRRVGCNY